MSKSRSTTAAAARSSSDAGRRTRTRLIVDAGRAALESFKAAVEQDCAKAQRILDSLEPWLEGGDEPEFLARYRELIILTARHDPRDPKTLAHREAQVELEHVYGHNFGLCEGVVHAAVGHAARERGPLDSAIGEVREAIEMQFLHDSSEIQEVVERAVNITLGAMPNQAG